MKSRVIVTLVALAAVPGSVLSKGDPAAGKKIAGACAACHGVNGVSPTDAWPNLAGQGHSYLVKQLKAFREGSRKDPLMEPLAKPLSDEQIENLAAYFSSLKPGSSSTQDLTTPDLPTVSSTGTHPPIIPSPDIVKPRPHPRRQYWVDQMPEGEGRAILVRKCQLCHDSQRTIAFARTKEQWRHVSESMIQRGTPLTAEELPVLTDYLARHFGHDSPPIIGPLGVPEVGMKPCKQSEWPRGRSDFRNWKGPYALWMSNQQGGNVDILDLETKKIVRRITCMSAPDRAEFSPDGNTAYVPDRVEHNVTVIDTRTGAIKAKIPVIDRPNTASLSRDGRKLYVAISPLRADEHLRGYVQILDTQTLGIVKTIETKGGIHYAWGSPDGKLLLAMSPQGKFLDVYDTRTEKKLYTCCADSHIGTMHVEPGPDGSSSRILLSYQGFYGIVVFDAKTGKELKRVPHPTVHKGGAHDGVRHEPGSPNASGFHGAEISPDGKSFWVMAGSVLFRYELPSLKPMGDVHLALVDQSGQPYTPAVEGTRMTISADGSKVYASRPGRNLLSIVDVKTMTEEALVPTGEYPLHLAIWPRGTP